MFGNNNFLVRKVAGILIACSSSLALSEVPHTFVSGTPASAAEVNENFNSLDSRLSTLEDSNQTSVTIDCSVDSTALISAIEAGKESIEVSSGLCLTPANMSHLNVSISGSASAGLDLASAGYGALRIDESSYIKLSNLSINGGITVFGNSNLVLNNVTFDCSAASICLDVKSSNLKVTGGLDIRGPNTALELRNGASSTFWDRNILQASQADAVRIMQNSSAKIEPADGGGTIIESDGDFRAIRVYESSNLRVNGGTVRGDIEVHGSSVGIAHMTYEANNIGSKEFTVHFASAADLGGVDLSGTTFWSGVNSATSIGGIESVDLSDTVFWVPGGALVISGGWLGTPDFNFWAGATGGFFAEGANTISGNFNAEQSSYVEFQNDYSFQGHTYNCADVSDIIVSGVSVCP